ncbi:MAG: hypothetical protein R3A51_11070 [Nannocystaceae bacterium]
MADTLLDQLGALEREDQEASPRAWEEVVAGARAVDDVAAAHEGPPGEAERLAALFAPMSDADAERLVERLAGVVKQSHARETPPSLSQARARRRGLWIGGGVTLAAAAAVLLWIRFAAGPSALETSLPGYQLAIRGPEVSVVRSGEPSGPAPRFSTGSRIHWVLSPDEPVNHELSAALHVRVWASSDDETRTALLDEAVRRSPTGALALRGILRELLPLPPGRWTLRFGLGASPIPAALEEARGDPQVQLTSAQVVEIVE